MRLTELRRYGCDRGDEGQDTKDWKERGYAKADPIDSKHVDNSLLHGEKRVLYHTVAVNSTRSNMNVLLGKMSPRGQRNKSPMKCCLSACSCLKAIDRDFKRSSGKIRHSSPVPVLEYK